MADGLAAQTTGSIDLLPSGAAANQEVFRDILVLIGTVHDLRHHRTARSRALRKQRWAGCRHGGCSSGRAQKAATCLKLT